jgi:AraC-like DNA-binding protein
MPPVLSDLIEIASRHVRGRRTTTAIPRVLISRSETPTPPESSLCEPAALFVLQGAKTVLIGDRTLRYKSGHHFVYTVEVPATGRVVEASAAHPYLAIGFRYDRRMAAALLADVQTAIGKECLQCTHPIDNDLLDALWRMLRLLDRPTDIPVLAPLIEREILFRLLQGPDGARLRQHVRADRAMLGIRRVTAWIRAHYDQPLEARQLAGVARMSVPSFYRHFKATTALSPIQYQKQIRLLAARQQLITTGNVASVALAVGYQSVSHFSRDYSRHFGTPPVRDTAKYTARHSR